MGGALPSRPPPPPPPMLPILTGGVTTDGFSTTAGLENKKIANNYACKMPLRKEPCYIIT